MRAINHRVNKLNLIPLEKPKLLAVCVPFSRCKPGVEVASENASELVFFVIGAGSIRKKSSGYKANCSCIQYPLTRYGSSYTYGTFLIPRVVVSVETQNFKVWVKVLLDRNTVVNRMYMTHESSGYEWF